MNAREVADQTKTRLLEFSEQLGSRRAAVEALNGFGLSTSWMLKFLNGEISNPTIDSVTALQKALDEQQHKNAA